MRYLWPAFLGLVYAGTAAALHLNLPAVPERRVELPANVTVGETLPDGRTVVLHSPEGEDGAERGKRFFDVDTGRCVPVASGRPGYVDQSLGAGHCLFLTTAPSHAGQAVNELLVVRVADGTVVEKPPGVDDGSEFHFRPHAPYAVFQTEDGTPWKRWDFASGAVRSLPFLPPRGRLVGLSNDGRWALMNRRGAMNRTATLPDDLWDLETGQNPRWSTPASGLVCGIVHSRNGKTPLALVIDDAPGGSPPLADGKEHDFLMAALADGSRRREKRRLNHGIDTISYGGHTPSVDAHQLQKEDTRGALVLKLTRWAEPVQILTVKGAEKWRQPTLPLWPRMAELSANQRLVKLEYELDWSDLWLRLHALVASTDPSGPVLYHRWLDTRTGALSPAVTEREVDEFPDGRRAVARPINEAGEASGRWLEVYELPPRRPWVGPLSWAWLPTGTLWVSGVLFGRWGRARSRRVASLP